MRRLLLWIVLPLGGLILALGNQTPVSSTQQDSRQIDTAENALLDEQATAELHDLTTGTDRRAYRNKLLGLEPGATVGLALGAGAAKGLAHIGVLKALEEAGIRPDFIAGSSVGALIGGAYAAGIPVDSIEQVALQRDWKDFTLLLDPALAKPGFIDGDKIEKFLKKMFYEDRRIQDLPIPFTATTTDIITGQSYVIDRGSLSAAVRSSISIPVIFAPQKYDEMYLVDGGLVDPVPINIVRSMGADFIIAVNVLVPPEKHEQVSEKSTLNADKINANTEESWFQRWKTVESELDAKPDLERIIQRTVMISQARIAQFQIDLSKPDMVIEPDTREVSSWDFWNGKEAIDLGYKAATEALQEFRMTKNEINRSKQ